MDIEELLQRGRMDAVERLFSMSSDCGGLDQVPAEERARIVQALRSLADTVEHAPQTVKGLVLIGAEHVVGDKSGIQSTVVLSGSAPIVAASHLLIEPHGHEAMGNCIPQLLMDALSNLEPAGEAANG